MKENIEFLLNEANKFRIEFNNITNQSNQLHKKIIDKIFKLVYEYFDYEWEDSSKHIIKRLELENFKRKYFKREYLTEIDSDSPNCAPVYVEIDLETKEIVIFGFFKNIRRTNGIRTDICEFTIESKIKLLELIIETIQQKQDKNEKF